MRWPQEVRRIHLNLLTQQRDLRRVTLQLRLGLGDVLAARPDEGPLEGVLRHLHLGDGHATGKEIAELAGTNSAAVNYYFGGIEGLYSEVLIEAHHRLMDFEFLKNLAAPPATPLEKLNAFIEGMIRAILGPASSSWVLRVLGREMLHPSASLQTLLDREVLPKKQITLGFVAKILGLPIDHPIVARCGLSIISPIALMRVGSPEMLKHAAPSEAVADQVDSVVKHFQRFITGGLSAIAANMEETGS